MDVTEKHENFERNDKDEIFSKPVRAGRRTYFFDVKATRGSDYFLTITESKKRQMDDGSFVFEKHKIFLYKEDFDKFTEGLQYVIEHIKCLREESISESGTLEAVGFDEFTDIEFDELSL